MRLLRGKFKRKIKITKSDAFPRFFFGMKMRFLLLWGLCRCWMRFDLDDDFRERLWLKNFFPFYWTFLSCQTIWVIINVLAACSHDGLSTFSSYCNVSECNFQKKKTNKPFNLCLYVFALGFKDFFSFFLQFNEMQYLTWCVRMTHNLLSLTLARMCLERCLLVFILLDVMPHHAHTQLLKYCISHLKHYAKKEEFTIENFYIELLPLIFNFILNIY